MVDLLHPARPYLLHPLQDQTLTAFRWQQVRQHDCRIICHPDKNVYGIMFGLQRMSVLVFDYSIYYLTINQVRILQISHLIFFLYIIRTLIHANKQII